MSLATMGAARRYREAVWTEHTNPPSITCNCIGPQNGDSVCPCQMRSVSIRNGRYVRVIDLGPAPSRDDGNSD